MERAFDLAKRIDTGTVWVNQHCAINPTILLRGAKQSEMGVELGVEGAQWVALTRSVPMLAGQTVLVMGANGAAGRTIAVARSIDKLEGVTAESHIALDAPDADRVSEKGIR
ncbi:aldehyde dehydrogenase family protein [Marinomonas sp. C1424]|uniref:Aldehyde dehydrogenase family protein n=1 Tax=Marinomonas transparens TaxID=2795388 RepID=A0A934JP28_9GAMM|nr:aldehyde dehydrogenase family protein [Marinomonas transparens]